MMDLAWSDLGIALGLALALEGLAYALAPDLIRRFYAIMLTEHVSRLRLLGVLAMATGVALIWLIRG